MVDLVPCPLPKLVARMADELDRKDAIFDLPRRRFWRGDPDHDLSVRFHGHRAATPLGPAAGPHSQMAQNIVLAWLGGSRIFELKTVQVLDELQIPRPCIDARNVGYNVEWSQELRLQQSLEEYVKGAMLIRMLEEHLGIEAGARDRVFDMSVGYDLAGIRSAPVQAFLAGMRDAGALVERFRAQIPARFARWRDLDFPTQLSDTLTLSTFHGCPPDEIEKIIDFLLRDLGLHCVIKLNPTLLGEAEVRRLLHDELGYGHVTVPSPAFAKDTDWDQAVGFVERLRATAAGLGLGLGVKFSNTLIVEHDGVFLPATEKEKYLSGAPLHVLAMHLVRRFRDRFGAAVPVSFSAGIDQGNFADAVSLGLTPITVCTDLLRPGGYARQERYLQALVRRMDAVGARDLEGFITATAGEVTRDAAVLANTARYVGGLAADARYAAASNENSPKKVGTQLELFDCLTCDKCVPVCPNDANFTLAIAPREVPAYALRRADGGTWLREDRAPLPLAKSHQIANFADFCNECGNCDVFCPEDGGPYLAKPRFFGDPQSFRRFGDRDGFVVWAGDGAHEILARIDGREYAAWFEGAQARFSGPGFSVEFDPADPAGTATGQTDTGVIDMRWFEVLAVLRESLFAPGDVNWVTA